MFALQDSDLAGPTSLVPRLIPAPLAQSRVALLEELRTDYGSDGGRFRVLSAGVNRAVVGADVRPPSQLPMGEAEQ